MIAAAERAAQALLDKHGIGKPPTPLPEIAAAEGILIVQEPFRDDQVSGVLVREPDKTVIIVNAGNSVARQRFTVAHELGHFTLHKGAIYLDGRARVNFRDGRSSMATDREEIGANAFAAALLMPAEWVRRDFESVVKNAVIDSEQNLADALSTRYGVSSQAMLFRLVNLGLIASP
ncbi:ImmA/IrrE family metallo-endopeptidase [Nocardia wallacei]|uniref:ImmA/IrrE family metallo-endopeptidase n=1 Tax=Nocardia wallacei TaxID=480035 RepID=UPI00245664C6|nr:ImmA/IrrE family metallo-endopeptidase [Nocardia wallacei]